MTEQHELEQLAKCMYKEAFSRLDERRAREVASKLTVLYGPPLVRPDVFLVSFQGGGKDSSPSRRTWPKRLLYLDDTYRFGKRLRKEFRDAGLFETLEKRTVAMAACFPEAPSKDAASWFKPGPKAEWREFSTKWVKRMIRKTRPRVVLVIGSKTSRALELEDAWRCVEKGRSANAGKVYGRAEIEDIPAVYCHHLSQGASADGVQKCLDEVNQLIARTSTG